MTLHGDREKSTGRQDDGHEDIVLTRRGGLRLCAASFFQKGGVHWSALACAELHQEPLSGFTRKEVFQPHLPVRLPCYDLAPITAFALGRSSRRRTSGAHGFHGLTGGVYKARERIHRAMADARLLANPASRSRVADSGPN